MDEEILDEIKETTAYNNKKMGKIGCWSLCYTGCFRAVPEQLLLGLASKPSGQKYKLDSLIGCFTQLLYGQPTTSSMDAYIPLVIYELFQGSYIG